MTDVTGMAPRLAALKLLDAVLRRGLPLEAALNAATHGIDRPADRALARAIAAETLRWLTDIDAMIDGATRNRLADDAKARSVIRLALAQVLVLGTPEHAAVATALPLVDGGPRRLVHGVLGTLLRKGETLPALPTLPDVVLARWHGAWGDAMIEQAQHAIAAPPPVDVTLKDPASTDAWAKRLSGTSLASGHVRLDRGTAIHDLAGYDQGEWWVQNIAASLPARLLGAGDGRAVLDLCAAPGGKTMQLAAAGWDVTAIDSDRARLVRLDDNLTRTSLTAKIVQADVMTWSPPQPVAAILLDAPCSSTGIFARHPDVLYRVRPKDIAEMAAIQAAMIARIADWLEPSGTLIYATCSLEPEEGEAHIAAARGAGLVINPVTSQELIAGITPHSDGWVRVLPHNHADGFFIARFTRA
ncbi:MAG: RsmB/NOP family class I SAM-dependent RNA methyltransferase [Sphingomonadaceae bacterium]